MQQYRNGRWLAMGHSSTTSGFDRPLWFQVSHTMQREWSLIPPVLHRTYIYVNSLGSNAPNSLKRENEHTFQAIMNHAADYRRVLEWQGPFPNSEIVTEIPFGPRLNIRPIVQQRQKLLLHVWYLMAHVAPAPRLLGYAGSWRAGFFFG